ncbi:MAG: hypothetical protein F6J93_23270 [Oscillatoria sp. SIO1A7]|nr:hypothetical protein [Oscillatoria sp. SIO1A7]
MRKSYSLHPTPYTLHPSLGIGHVRIGHAHSICRGGHGEPLQILWVIKDLNIFKRFKRLCTELPQEVA